MSNNDDFTISDAVRSRVYLITSIVGCQGAGKTKSALELATGIASVDDGPIVVIDTENNRSLLYAESALGRGDGYAFKHLPFHAPWGPDRYEAAIDKALKLHPSVIVIDTMTHEHDAEGGVLDRHAQELRRRAGKDYNNWRIASKYTAAAWLVAKEPRKRLMYCMQEANCHLILTFWAKEKTDWNGKKGPQAMGFAPVGGQCYLRQAVLSAYLPPGADGHADWKPSESGALSSVKRPDFFQPLIDDLIKNKAPITRDLGAAMARWAQGDAGASQPTQQPPNAPTRGDITKRIIAAYKPYGVTAADLGEWIGGPVGSVSDDVVEELREMLAQIKAGKSHPADFFQRLRDIVDDGPPPDDAPHPAESGA